MNNRDLGSQTLTLRDGRTLGYAEWGDFEGKPVFYFSSAEASRYSRHPDNSILTGLGVHLYTFDRPGRGLSSSHRGRRLLDWAQDIQDFVQQKNITWFALLGHSQGSVHALACAYALPDLVSSLTLVTNVAGIDDTAVKTEQRRYFRTQLFMARYVPWLMTLQWNILRFTLKGKGGEKILLDNMRSFPERDQATLKTPGSHEVMFQSMREGLRQGGTSITEDFRITTKDWGFRLEDIQNQAFIWHGEGDTMLTPAMSRYMAARLPHNEAHIIPEEGNLLIYSRWHDIFEQILDHWRKRAS